jgi:hypothetical protein
LHAFLRTKDGPEIIEITYRFLNVTSTEATLLQMLEVFFNLNNPGVGLGEPSV